MRCARPAFDPVLAQEMWQNASAVDGMAGLPRAAFGGSMAYDAYDGYVVYFGGSAGDRGVGETWTFTGRNWTNLTPVLGISPPAEVGAAMGYDTTTEVVLLYGGCTAAACPTNATWYYTGSTGWTNITATLSPASPPLWEGSMAFAADSWDGYTVLFGGCMDVSCAAPSNRTYGFDGFGWVLIPTTHSPPAGWSNGLAYDPAFGGLVLFGGCTNQTCGENQTWTYFNFDWTNQTAVFGGGAAAPAGRSHLLLTWDELDQTLLLFGGKDDIRAYNDTWGLNCSAVSCRWANLTAPTSSIAPFFDMAAPSDSNATIGTMFFGGTFVTLGVPYLGSPTASANGTFFFEPGLRVTVQIPGSLPARTEVPVAVIPTGGSGEYPQLGSHYFAIWRYSNTVVTGLSVNLSFDLPGTYRVVLLAYDEFGVGVLYPFQYLATGPSTRILGGSEVWVENPLNLSATPASGGTPPYSYAWDFGDGGTATGLSVSHRWAVMGEFRVSLDVTDHNGVPFDASTTVEVLYVGVAVSASSYVLDVGQTVSFSSSVGGSTGALGYLWSFGDGTPDSFQLFPQHEFDSPGTYNVTLTVTNTTGSQANGSLDISVNPALGGNISAVPSSAVVGAPVNLTVTPVGGTAPYSFDWRFGDGGADYGASVVHRYLSPGRYTATVYVNDSSNESILEQVQVTIRAASPNGGPPSASSGLDLLPIVLILVMAGVVVVGLVAWRRQRRRRTRRSSPRIAPRAAKGPPGAVRPAGPRRPPRPPGARE